MKKWKMLIPLRIIIRSQVISMAVLLVLLLVCAAGLHSGELGETNRGYAVAACLLVSAMTGMGLGCRNVEEGRLLAALVHAAVMWIFAMLLGVLFFRGSVQAAVQTGMLIMGGSLAAGLCLRGKTHKKKTGVPVRRKGRIVHFAQIGK